MRVEAGPSNAPVDGTIRLCGRVDTPDFPAWISRHATKLGVELQSTQRTSQWIVLRVTGAQEMIHALALACSLGPKSVLIDEMEVQIAFKPQEMRGN